MADDLDIARIRAYAGVPAGMPETRYTARESPTRMNIEIVRLSLVNGVEGIASSISGWAGKKGGKTVCDIAEISARILGQSVRTRAGLTELLLAEADEGPWDAISLVDCAMWDAYARTLRQPLWQLLGGHQQSIAAYASTPAYLSVPEYLDDTRRLAAEGYRAVKFHMNTDPEFDLEMVRVVAKAHENSALRFMVDLEQRYTVDEAVRLGEVLARLPFDWMEAPLPDNDLDAYVELNKAVDVDVLPAGNTLVGLENWADGLSRKAWSRLRCDACNAGGITNVAKAMGLARAMNVEVELQSFGFQPAQCANLNLMLGFGGCTWFEHPAPHHPYDYATHNPLVLDAEGCVVTPEFGLDMDWQTIETDAFVTFDSAQ